MKEIDIKDNDTELRVFINGVPDLTLILKDEAAVVLTVLELEITEYFKNKDDSNSKTTISLNSSNIS